jgi:hypothetical protein
MWTMAQEGPHSDLQALRVIRSIGVPHQVGSPYLEIKPPLTWFACRNLILMASFLQAIHA